MTQNAHAVIQALGGIRKTAQKLGVSKSHVHRWSASGEVIRLGHALTLCDVYLPADASAADRLALLRGLAGGQKHGGRGTCATPSAGVHHDEDRA